MSPDLNLIVSGLQAKKRGTEWMARCPAHEDRSPSLAVAERDGTVVVKCHAGCAQADVIAALRERGLWPEPSSAGAAQATPTTSTTAPKITRYEYHAPDGELLAVHKRIDLPSGKKAFSWLKADGSVSDGAVAMHELPLYGVSALASSPDDWVIVTEGEKACDAARSLGLLAVSLPGGAAQTNFGNALLPLHGRKVALWPDNDGPGRTLAGRLYAALRGKASRLVTLEIPNLPEKGDAFDFAQQRRAASEVLACINTAEAARLPRLISAPALLEKEFPPPKTIVRGLLYQGSLLLAGRPKLGKSWCGLGLAISIASGGHALGRIPVEAGDVLYLGLEDGDRRLKERIAGLLGDTPAPERLSIATTWPRLDDGGTDALDLWLAGHPDARLVVVDTLKRVRPRGDDRRQLYDLDYEAVAPLNDLAHRYGVCILIVHHTRKADADDPLDLISGTLGLTGAVDGALVLKRSRGQVDATLAVACRDAEDCELALRWDGITQGWVLLGDAAQYQGSGARTEILDALHNQPGMYPREIASVIDKEPGAVRKLLYDMFRDGEVRVQGGRYYANVAKQIPSNTGNGGNAEPSLSGKWPKDRYPAPIQPVTVGNGTHPSITGVTPVTSVTGVTPIPSLPAFLPYIEGENGAGSATPRLRRVL